MITTRDRDEFLVSTVIKLIKRNAAPNLRKVIAKTHSADIARWFPHLRVDEKLLLFRLVAHEELMGDVLRELNTDDRLLFLEEVETATLADILRGMAPDDVSDLIADLPEDRRAEYVALIEGDASEDVQQLLEYEEKTAGSIMNPQFFSLPEDMTASDAVLRIQEMADVEMVFYVYVVDSEMRLEGVISLRQLVTTPPHTPLRDLMTRRLYKVHVTAPQEEVAHVAARYNVLAVPVVGDEDQLMGIVTVDDVIDVIVEENTEDMLRMAGTGDVELGSLSVWRSTRARAPWLFASCVGGATAAYLIGLFEGELEQFAALTAFIPVIMGMGGNIGTQSSTIIVRGPATGEVDMQDRWKVLRREFATGAALGGLYGVLLGVFARLRHWTTDTGSPYFVRLPIVVMLAIAGNMILAASLGALIPMALRRMRIDPAIATGPVVTTSIDVVGIVFYFMLARVILF
jgi:magnesium transporter